VKILFRIIVGFLAVIGALTVALAAYLYLADPLGLGQMFQPPPTSPAPTTAEPASNPGQYNLSPAQKFFLEKAGIDPNALPSTISPELEQCLVNAVGEERANQIKAGDVPTPIDLLKAKSCLGN